MWPDVDFSFPGAALICDHLRHSTTVVVNAVIDEEDPRRCSTSAIKQLDEIVDVLIAAPPESDPDTERLVAERAERAPPIEIRSIAAAPVELHPRAVRRGGANAPRSTSVAGDVFQVVPSQQFRRRDLGRTR